MSRLATAARCHCPSRTPRHQAHACRGKLAETPRAGKQCLPHPRRRLPSEGQGRKEGGDGAAVAHDAKLDVVVGDSFDNEGCIGNQVVGGNLGLVDAQGIGSVDAQFESYPTDLAVRQKEDRKAREEKLAEHGLTQEEIKKLRKKKKFNQEQRFDDRGSDLGLLEEAPFVNCLATSGSFNASIAYSFFDDDAFRSSSVDSSEGEAEIVLGDNFALWYGVGCDGADMHQDPPKSTVIDVDDLLVFLATLENAGGAIDVVEIFGGEGGVGKLCVRRRLRRGRNFDLVIGFDFIDQKHRQTVFTYLKIHRPLVALLGPPCTGFGHWSHLNRYIHPDTFHKIRKVGECLAVFVAEVIWVQLHAGATLFN